MRKHLISEMDCTETVPILMERFLRGKVKLDFSTYGAKGGITYKITGQRNHYA